MIARFSKPATVALKRLLPLACAVAILFTLTLSSMISWPLLSATVLPMVLASIAFALAAATFGWLISAKRPRAVRTAASMEFGIRNLPIALLLVGHFTKDVQAVAYLLVFFVANTLIFIIYACIARTWANEVKSVA
jgi:hypothetical protein